jgi:Domain of unknown function (DUF3327)
VECTAQELLRAASEPLTGDKENMLVTFLWRGAPDTQNVFVARLPYAGAAPDDYFMNRMGQTDVWYKSIPIDSKARFEYTLAPNVPSFSPCRSELIWKGSR